MIAAVHETLLRPFRVGTRPQNAPHIIDQLIAERTPHLSSSILWPMLRHPLNAILHYGQAVAMADAVAGLSGRATFDHASARLNLSLSLRGASNIPKHGAFLLAPNHPTGIADGIAIYDALARIRPDLAFVANRDALRVNPALADLVIPVEWRADAKNHGKSRETLAGISRAIGDDRAIVVFPSGRLAHWKDGALTERPWQGSVVGIARRHGIPIVPVNLSGRNSRLFYLLARLSDELRDMTLFHELLNKRGGHFDVTIGAPIPPERLAGRPNTVAEGLRHHCCTTLPHDPGALFKV